MKKIAIDKRLSWIKDLAADMEACALDEKRCHQKHFVCDIKLNAIIGHALDIARQYGILNMQELPALYNAIEARKKTRFLRYNINVHVNETKR